MSEKCPTEIEEVVDKIRYAGDQVVEQEYITQLLRMFDPESGDYISDKHARGPAPRRMW